MADPKRDLEALGAIAADAQREIETLRAMTEKTVGKMVIGWPELGLYVTDRARCSIGPLSKAELIPAESSGSRDGRYVDARGRRAERMHATWAVVVEGRRLEPILRYAEMVETRTKVLLGKIEGLDA